MHFLGTKSRQTYRHLKKFSRHFRKNFEAAVYRKASLSYSISHFQKLLVFIFFHNGRTVNVSTGRQWVLRYAKGYKGQSFCNFRLSQ